MFRAAAVQLMHALRFGRHLSLAGKVRRDANGIFLLALILLSCTVNPAFGQLSGELALQNDERFRGRSTSRGQPVAIGSLSYDHKSGLYTGGSIAVTVDDDIDLDILRYAAFVGYAYSVKPGLSLDGGAVFTSYTDAYSGEEAESFIEFFGGLSVGDISAHVRYAPDHLNQDVATLYTDIEAVQDIGSGFRIHGRGGLLNQIGGSGSLGGARTRYDVQVGVTKDIDLWSFSATFGTAGPGRGDYFDGPWMGRNSLVLRVSRSF